MRCTKYFDTLKRLGVNHQCDRQTDRQNCNSNSATTRATNYMHFKWKLKLALVARGGHTEHWNFVRLLRQSREPLRNTWFGVNRTLSVLTLWTTLYIANASKTFRTCEERKLYGTHENNTWPAQLLGYRQFKVLHESLKSRSHCARHCAAKQHRLAA